MQKSNEEKFRKITNSKRKNKRKMSRSDKMFLNDMSDVLWLLSFQIIALLRCRCYLFILVVHVQFIWILLKFMYIWKKISF